MAPRRATGREPELKRPGPSQRKLAASNGEGAVRCLPVSQRPFARCAAVPAPRAQGARRPGIYYSRAPRTRTALRLHHARGYPAPRGTQRAHTGPTSAAQRAARACGQCTGQPDSGYRRWPGWMLSYPFRLRFPDLTPTSCGRGQENSSSTEQHPARQKQRSKSRNKIKIKTNGGTSPHT